MPSNLVLLAIFIPTLIAVAAASLHMGWLNRAAFASLCFELQAVELVSHIPDEVRPRAWLPVTYDGHEIALKIPELEDESNLAVYVLAITDDAAGQLTSTRGGEEDTLFHIRLPRRHRLLGLGAEYSGTDNLLHLILYCETPFTFLHRKSATLSLNLELAGAVETETPRGKPAYVKEGNVIRIGGT